MCAEDVNFTANASAISAEWARAADEESAIAGAVWAAGAWPGDDSMVAWQPVIDVRASSGLAATTGGALGANDTRNSTWVLAAVAPGILQHNSFYIVTVKVRNGAGLWATAHSDGVRVDLTPPVVHKVLSLDPTQPIGVIKETAVQVATNMASVAVHAGDPESGLLEWHYGIGSAPGLDDVRTFVALPLNASSKQPLLHAINTDGGLALTPGETYYHVVRAVNNAGLASTAQSSAGFTIGLRAQVGPLNDTMLYFDPFQVGSLGPSVTMVANITVGTVGAVGQWIGTIANGTSLQSTVHSVGTPLSFSGYARLLDTGAASPAHPVQLQLLYRISGGSDALPEDVDPWLVYYSPGTSSRRLRDEDKRVLAALPEGWHPVESTCGEGSNVARTVNYTARVLSGYVCEGGTVAVFMQQRPSVGVPDDVVLSASASRVVQLSGLAADADGQVSAVKWSWTATAPPYATAVAIEDDSQAVTTATPVLEGTTTFTMTATDNVGARRSASFSVTVLPFPTAGECGSVSFFVLVIAHFAWLCRGCEFAGLPIQHVLFWLAGAAVQSARRQCGAWRRGCFGGGRGELELPDKHGGKLCERRC